MSKIRDQGPPKQPSTQTPTRQAPVVLAKPRTERTAAPKKANAAQVRDLIDDSAISDVRSWLRDQSPLGDTVKSGLEQLAQRYYAKDQKEHSGVSDGFKLLAQSVRTSKADGLDEIFPPHRRDAKAKELHKEFGLPVAESKRLVTALARLFLADGK